MSVPYQRVMTNGRLRQKQAALLTMLQERGFIILCTNANFRDTSIGSKAV